MKATPTFFDYGKNDAARNIIVGIEHGEKNFLVGMFLNPMVKGKYLEIYSIRNVFPKDTNEWVNWIQQGKLLGGNTKKIQDLITKQRINLADVAYIDLDFGCKDTYKRRIHQIFRRKSFKTAQSYAASR